MRPLHTLPLAAAIVLAACGSSETDADADGEISGEEVAAAAEGAVQMRPGQYRVSVEMLDADMPGVPEAVQQQMRGRSANSVTEYCLTAEDAADARRQVIRNVGQGDCTTSNFNVSGGTVVAEMQCEADGGMKITVKMEGEVTSESSDMTSETTMQMPGAGTSTSKTRVTQQRIGDCPA